MRTFSTVSRLRFAPLDISSSLREMCPTLDAVHSDIQSPPPFHRGRSTHVQHCRERAWAGKESLRLDRCAVLRSVDLRNKDTSIRRWVRHLPKRGQIQADQFTRESGAFEYGPVSA